MSWRRNDCKASAVVAAGEKNDEQMSVCELNRRWDGSTFRSHHPAKVWVSDVKWETTMAAQAPAPGSGST